MALLSKLFDVLRGWPKEGAIDETFAIKLSSGVPVSIPQGSVVQLQSADGSVDLAVTPTTVTPVMVAVESNDDFSSKFVKKAVCLRGNCVLKLDPANYVSGSYSPGTLLTYETATGKFTAVSGSHAHIIGEVWSVNSADSTMVVYFQPTFTKD